MRSNREILDWINRCRNGKTELKKHLNTIEQIKLEMVLSNQKHSQLKSISSKQMNPECQTAESLVDDRRQFTQGYYPQYAQHLSQEKSSYLYENSNAKQDTDTIDDIFKLSQTDQSQSYQSKAFYDSLNQQYFQSEKSNSNQHFNKYQEQQLKQSLQQIDQKLNQIQNREVKNKKQLNEQEQPKTFDQYYQEYVEDEITNIHHEISEMQKFLNRIQTAKDRLSSSVQDLSYQNSQRSMQKLNQELDIIQTLRNNMQTQLKNNVDGDKLQRLRMMKAQIQDCFNDLEEELIKLSK